MTQDYHHGVRVTELPSSSGYIRTVNSGIIGMVATAPDADDETFPLNVPKLVTNVRSALGKAGDTGTLAHSLDAIASQTSPIAVIVRVPEGETPAETSSNVIGTVTENQQYTGLKSLLMAQSLLGVTPRIIGAPGLDTQEVTNEMVSIAQHLRSFVYAKCHGETIPEMINYRKQFGARELMLIAPDFLGFDTQASQTNIRMATAYALGLRARIDNEIGFHKTLSNVVVNGPLGIDKDISWALQSPNTDAGLLNKNDITTLIQQDGYRFWGNRTCSSDPMFVFESSVRTSQIIADTIAEAHFRFVDGIMTPGNVRDIVENVNARLRQWVTLNYILGGSCWYDPSLNENTSLAAGNLNIDYDFTTVVPMEDINFNQRITDRYFADFSQRVTQG